MMRVQVLIRARVRLRYEPWRMYGPAVGGPLRYTKRQRVNLWQYLNDLNKRLGALRS